MQGITSWEALGKFRCLQAQVWSTHCMILAPSMAPTSSEPQISKTNLRQCTTGPAQERETGSEHSSSKAYCVKPDGLAGRVLPPSIPQGTSRGQSQSCQSLSVAHHMVSGRVASGQHLLQYQHRQEPAPAHRSYRINWQAEYGLQAIFCPLLP